MPTKLLKRTNTRTNKRRLRVSATQSLPSCIKLPEDPLEVQEVCPEVCQEDLEQEAAPPSKKSTNRRRNSNFPPLFFSSRSSNCTSKKPLRKTKSFLTLFFVRLLLRH